MKHVFIIGAKSIGAYGGYETFVDKLTEYQQDNNEIKYHISVKANGQGSLQPQNMKNTILLNENDFEYHNCHCFRIHVPDKIGSAQAIYYDYASLKYVCDYVKKENISNFVVYILACRIGLFIKKFSRTIHSLGGKIMINPDGHEWMRTKWSKPVRHYWKYSEKEMIKHTDLVICDSKNIEKYVLNEYKKYIPKTTYIAYGAETRKSLASDEQFMEWKNKNDINDNDYFLIVGRFVPENNFETMIKEFMASQTKKNLVIISTKDNAFFAELNNKLNFCIDKRIKFVGTIYDAELLLKIRENAFAYLHGHEVGGTNPSLLEALGATKLNLLLKVGFNEEVGENAVLYWTKEPGDLATLVNTVDKMSRDEQTTYEHNAKARIQTAYSWNYISSRYESVFLGE